MFSDRVFTSEPVEYAAGDLFVILTDGLTEVFDARDIEFGLDRVKSVVRERARASLETIEDQLMTEVRKHGRQLDDQTLLLVRVLA
jgi:sigma-B regulation protein RsbU (phosphoserine phosphatase)